MIRNFFNRLMYGRYGSDMLSLFLVTASLVLWIISGLVKVQVISTILWVISYAALIFSIFRMFSRNLYKRQAENQKWLQARSRRRSAASAAKARRADTEHKYFTCRQCKAICRVPVGKGKVIITCPKCGAEIHGKT